MPGETYLVGYADDIGTLIPLRTVDQTELKLNTTMTTVNSRIEDNGLTSLDIYHGTYKESNQHYLPYASRRGEGEDNTICDVPWHHNQLHDKPR